MFAASGEVKEGRFSVELRSTLLSKMFELVKTLVTLTHSSLWSRIEFVLSSIRQISSDNINLSDVASLPTDEKQYLNTALWRELNTLPYTYL